ncbi:MerR family transcriptional regulator, partial [Streptomyces smyrnaeus]
MAWSIADVARMSGVTSRTLRHYDQIGLLPPAWIGSNGHRYYEQAELLRLQQILLMRELDVGLREIRAVLDSQVDQVAVGGARPPPRAAGGAPPRLSPAPPARTTPPTSVAPATNNPR